MPVYPSSSGEKMEYEEQRSTYRRGLDEVNIIGGKSTHRPRSEVQKITERG